MTGKNQTTAILEACIELELAVASLYSLYCTLHPEDRAFWAQLHLEERSHAAILRSALDSFSRRNQLPDGILPVSLDMIREALANLLEIRDRFARNPPCRREACKMAIEFEHAIGEQHYNQFMGKEPESNIEEVFQQLNRNDKDHAERIAQYLSQIP